MGERVCPMKTFHRNSSHAKRQHFNQLPKFWQPKIDEQQQLDCKLTHWNLFDLIRLGQADSATLWDWIETGFTYSQFMRLMAADGVDFTDEAAQALADQLNIYEDVIARYRKTGRVGFNGQQINIARAACYVMDGLIEMDRHGIAVKAALWSLEQMTKIRGTM
ncbi:hypothetical protein [Rhodoferax sp. GW822-FHT02A01]|uniref:hypothetical protein n=1 Tax=Rhodoferax sp. GW822-FHT02A01 TaxID=3141537 RepID=UPI00315CEF6D